MAADTATGDDAPPENAVALSDDDIDDLVDEAVGDIATTAATDDEPEPTPAKSRAESRKGAESEQAAVGEEGTVDDEPEAAAPKAAPAAPPEPARAAAPGKPFKFKASGAEHQFHGVDELADGSLRVSKEATPQFRGVLASYVELQRTSKEQRRDLQRQLNAATKGRSDKDLEADAVTKLFKDIQGMSPEERWAWSENFTENAKGLELEIRRQAIDRKEKALEAREKGPELLPEEQEEHASRAINQEVYDTFTRLLASPEAKHLPNEDRQALYRKWQAKGIRLATRATKDMPEIGVAKGQLYFDDTDIVEDFLERVALRKQTGKTVTAAQRNQKLNADQNGRRPPPAVRGGKPPATGGKKAVPDLRGKKKEFKKAFMASELDTPGDD